MLKMEMIHVGVLSVNCYLLWNSDTMEAYIVDPGDDAERIQAEVTRLNLKPKAVLLTHGHVDHIRAVGAVTAAYGIPVWIHRDELPLYNDPKNALLPWIPAADDLPKPVVALPKIDGITPVVLHTPGHSLGSVCFHYPEEKLLFSGDTLFKGTIGRTDFPGGSYKTIMESIHEKLLCLPDVTQVFPGHEETTTIGKERTNPMFL